MKPIYIGEFGRQGLHVDEHVARLIIATHILSGMMIISGPSKENKVKAAFEYADLLLKG